jgi:hypothetical protein
MPRKQKDFTFSNGDSLVVWQATLDISMSRAEIEEQARSDRAKLNGSGDKELLFFHEVIYPGLAAASEGDVPAVADAFRMTPTDWDAWHLAVAEVNPRWYTIHEYRQEEVEISGRKITVLSLRPSVMMRRVHFEREAEKGPALLSPRREAFRIVQYPMLAGCSIGDVPSFDEALKEWSEDEMQAWYEPARRLVPEWFMPLEEAALKNQQAADEEKKTRKSRTRK